MERPADDPSLSAFERTARQIAEEERLLRLLAEERLRDFTRLALDFASVFLTAELDARIRVDPYFLDRVTAADWRSMIQAAQQRPPARVGGWPAAQTGGSAETERWRAEALRLTGEVTRLQSEVIALAGRLTPASGPAPVPAADADLALVFPAEPTQIAPELTPVWPLPVSGLPPLTKPAVPAGPPAAPWADVSLPALPALAPSRFADQLRNWARESLALCALGMTGWSMRFAIAELMSARLGGVQPNAGSLRRVFDNLARRGFWHEERVAVRGLHRTPDAGDATTLILVRLTELGREVLQACGVQTAPSEWERLLAAHGGSAQTAHAGLVCAITYHARRRGYATTVCPEVAGPAAPDVHVARNDESLYVEVEDESGSVERRLRKWRNQAALQGRAAIATVTPAARTNLVNEARAAACEHGVATDLQTLMETQETGGPLWIMEW